MLLENKLPIIIRRGAICSLILLSPLLAIKQAIKIIQTFPASSPTIYWKICRAIALPATFPDSINLWYTFFVCFHCPIPIPCHALTSSCPPIGTVKPRSTWSLVNDPRSFKNHALHPITARELVRVASALCSCSFSRRKRAPRRLKRKAEVKKRAVKSRGGRREWG